MAFSGKNSITNGRAVHQGLSSNKSKKQTVVYYMAWSTTVNGFNN